MKNKLRFMALLIVAVLCMTAFTVPAFAESGDYPDEQPENPTLRIRLTIPRP